MRLKARPTASTTATRPCSSSSSLFCSAVCSAADGQEQKKPTESSHFKHNNCRAQFCCRRRCCRLACVAMSSSMFATLRAPLASRLTINSTHQHHSHRQHQRQSHRTFASSLKAPSSSSNNDKLDCYIWGTSSTVKYPNVAKTMLRPTPMIAPDASGFQQVVFGQQHTAVLTGNGSVFTYGDFSKEAPNKVTSFFGFGAAAATTAAATTLQRVEGIPTIKQIEVGTTHTALIDTDGVLYTYGFGGSMLHTGALGHSNSNTLTAPQAVSFADAAAADTAVVIASVAAGSYHNIALSTDGRVYAFGRGEYGRLGNGSSSDSATPVLLQALQHTRITEVRCGTSFNAVVDDDGRVFTWGRNNSGQLGLGSGLILDQYSMEAAPCEVEFVDNNSSSSSSSNSGDGSEESEIVRVVDVDCGHRHAVAVDDSGRVWTWGQGTFTPTVVRGDHDKFVNNINIKQVAAGKNFTAAVDEHGHLFTWGDGSSCCLGHGNKSSVKQPTLVAGFGPNKAAEFGRVVQVFAGDTHICVLVKKD